MAICLLFFIFEKCAKVRPTKIYLQLCTMINITFGNLHRENDVRISVDSCFGSLTEKRIRWLVPSVSRLRFPIKKKRIIVEAFSVRFKKCNVR